MATKRRRPGTLPPALTEEQAAQVRRCHPIGVHVAMYYVRKRPPGLTADDLLGAAEEAVTLAVCTYTTEKKVALEGYVWARVRSTLKTLIRRTAERLGSAGRSDCHESRVALAGGEALDEYGQALEDRGNVLRDTPEQQIAQYDDVAKDAATAQVIGGGGHIWNMRGDLGLVLRIDYLRMNKAVHDEVARLPAAHATIMELRFFRELPVKVVAARAGVSESTVFRMIGEAIPLLKARLEARGIKDLSGFEGR